MRKEWLLLVGLLTLLAGAAWGDGAPGFSSVGVQGELLYWSMFYRTLYVSVVYAAIDGALYRWLG
jgi:hypothetical protein